MKELKIVTRNVQSAKVEAASEYYSKAREIYNDSDKSVKQTADAYKKAWAVYKNAIEDK